MTRIAAALVLVLAASACTAGPAVPAAPNSPSPTAVAAASPSPTPFTAIGNEPLPSPLASDAPMPTPDPTPPAGSTPFPTPGPTITPGSTRVIGTLRRPDGTPAAGVCVVLQKGICPIATDDQGVWFTDIPAGPITWNFIYRVDSVEVGRQFVVGTSGGELRLGVYTLTG